jgi:hypothetical protein
MEKNIHKRIIAEQIIKYLNTDDIVVLHGARQVGKTSILYWLKDYLAQKNKDVYYIDLEDSRFVKILDAGIQIFIKHLQEEGFWKEHKKMYVFIDEIQYLDNPSQFLKLIADHHKNIKLVVSGSSSFEIKNKFKDSLVGRTVEFEIFNLSFEEFLIFKDYYFDGKKDVTDKKIAELQDLFTEYILYGGYPKIVLTKEKKIKEKYLQQIIDTYIRKDIRDLAQIQDVEKFNKLIEALSSQSGQLLNIVELANTSDLSKQTIEKYLFILENTYIIKLVRPYHQNIRSELFKTPKIFFYDSGLLQMLRLKELPKEITGDIFETSVFSELVKKYNKSSVYYWRTKDKKEIDFILKNKNKIMPIEAKLNFAQFNPSAMKYFINHYRAKQYKAVALKGKIKNLNYIYPWSL